MILRPKWPESAIDLYTKWVQCSFTVVFKSRRILRRLTPASVDVRWVELSCVVTGSSVRLLSPHCVPSRMHLKLINIHCTSQHIALFMAALRSRCGHYIFALWFLSTFYLLFLFIANGRRLDVYHTSTDGVTLVRFRMQVWSVLHAARWK